jgi:putative ABC transport system permease protein
MPRKSHPRGSIFASGILDLKYVVRGFAKTPGFTTTVIVTVALGIGANAAVFPFLYGFLLRPLPFDEPGRLAVLFENAPRFTRTSASYPNFVDWRDQSHTFDDMAAYSATTMDLTGGGTADRLTGGVVSHNFFDVLGIPAAQGRGFVPDDDLPGAPPTVILGHGVWMRRFGGSPEIIRGTVTLDGEAYTVVGIMPRGFRFPDQADYWVPLRRSATSSRRSYSLRVVGRLSTEASFETAQRDMHGIAAQLAAAYPETNGNRGIVVRPLREDLLWGRTTPVLAFYVVVCLLLLLACTNVANLLLVRASDRSREIAMRSALGAGRWRITRQLLTESVLLAMIGGGGGLLMGAWGRNVVLGSLPDPFPSYFRFDMDIPVVLALFTITVVCGISFGLAPVMGTAGINLFDTLRAGPLAGFRKNRLHGLLVVSQVGIAVVVLIGAGLMIKSVHRLNTAAVGFERENLLTVRLSIPNDRYAEGSQQVEFYETVRERIQSLSGIVGVTGVSHLPMTGSYQRSEIFVEGLEPPEPGQEQYGLVREIQPDYFRIMDIPLVSGSDFHEGIAAARARPVVIVDESFARRFWPGGTAIGKRIKYGVPDSEWPWMEVVGVVGNTHHFALDIPVEMGIYRPLAQEPVSWQTLIVRAAGNPLQSVNAIRSAIWAIDPNIPLDDIRTIDQAVQATYWNSSAQMWLLSALALVSLLLAAFGVYGVVAYSVSRRTREFGIRMALGAQRMRVVKLVLQHSTTLSAAGLLAGIATALAVTRFAASLLFEVRSMDLPTYLGASLLMAAVALLAGYLPASRATRADPATVLRSE